MAVCKGENLNFFVKTLIHNGFSCTDMHQYLTNTWGEDNVPSLRQVQRLAKEFKDGTRAAISRQPGSGRPRTSLTAANVQIVQTAIENDPTISLSRLTITLNLDKTSVYRILTKELSKRSVYAVWVPHELTDYNKERRVTGAQVILEEIHGGVIVIDEKWVYAKPFPHPQNVRAWVDKQSNRGDRPTLARKSMADKKYHIIVGMNFRGDSYFEVLEANETVNAARYVEFLEHIQTIRRQRITIMHDNARPHTSNLTTNFLINHNIQRVPQPPYSPDFNLCDRLIFRNFETSRVNNIFDDRESLRIYLQDYLNKFSRYILTNELASLRTHMENVIAAEGEYI